MSLWECMRDAASVPSVPMAFVFGGHALLA